MLNQFIKFLSKSVFFISLIIFSIDLSAQSSNLIRGITIDESSGEKLPFVSIIVLNTAIPKGTTSDINGEFVLENLPIGRYDVEITHLGYEPAVFKEILISSGKEVFLTVALRQSIVEINEVVVTPKLNKQETLNNTTLVSGKMLSMEEASRYAGGFDDPTRLVSAFAGVSGSTSSNGVAIRGNSPQFLQWRLEGVEIPNPTHFPDMTSVGGGILTALSSQVLGNSDFLTGAFPAEYSNALSGVFDMQMRNGNRWKYEHSFQAGFMGADFSSEGPFKHGKPLSYLFNYRYSTLSLLGKIVPGLIGDAAGLGYQDLAFKLNFPTQKAGTFSVWGIGIIDDYKTVFDKDTTTWVTSDDQLYEHYKFKMLSTGVGHKYYFDNNTYLKSTVAYAYKANIVDRFVYDTNLEQTQVSDIVGSFSNVIINGYLNKKFSAKYSNRTGITSTFMSYDFDYKRSPRFVPPTPMEHYMYGNGSSFMLSAFSNSTFRLNEKLTINGGLNVLYFDLTKSFSLEPRLGMRLRLTPKQTIGLGYGKHSRIEKLDTYFIVTGGTNELVNKNLAPAKAHHIVMSYDWRISENMHLKIEPYYQYLYDVPVSDAQTNFSIINLKDWFLNMPLTNEGKGRNYGIDITFERYLTKGYYYLFTASFFDSRYTSKDDIWRNTRFNKNYIFNLLGGKEWNLNKRNILGVNTRLSVQGGERYSPIDEELSKIHQRDVFDETRAFENQYRPTIIADLTVSYKMNREKTTHEIAFKILNILGTEEYNGCTYNYIENKVEWKTFKTIMPNISYKINF